MDDLEDIASAKALDLLLRAESGEWDPTGRHAGEVAAYIATVARNGLLRWAERNSRTVRMEEPGDEPESAPPATALSPAADTLTEAGEFVAVLRECVRRLQPRARRIWILRAFHELSSRDIAAHPDVGLTKAHVDVVVSRARDVLKQCLGTHGHRTTDYPAGAFMTLWEALSDMNDSPRSDPKGAHGSRLPA